MIDIDFHLRDFSNRCRLFPLPEVVLFPHALLPLHIFEPRYRQMTEDALADDGLITMVQIRPTAKSAPWSEPAPILDVGCVGRIVKHERLPDGRFNFLLLGLKRVRLVRENPSGRLYRIAEAELLHDHESTGPLEPRRTELINLFLQVIEKREPLDDDLTRRLKSSISLGTLSDIVAHALGLPPIIQQNLLAETEVDRRVETLCTILHSVVDETSAPRGFPPPFSLN
jgi:Lon protease-like protein